MRNGAVIAILLVCLAAIFFLLNSEDDVARGHRSTGSDAIGGAGATGDVDSADVKTAAGAADARGNADRDPNRIPGPALVLRGLVLASGKPLGGATVTAHRAFPDFVTNAWNNPAAREYTENPFPPIGETTTSGDGRFEIRIARRTRLTIEARAPGYAVTRGLIYIPGQSNPAEITLRLEPGFEFLGRVTNHKAEPIAAAKVRAILRGNWRVPPAFVETETSEAGEFSFDMLSKGMHGIEVTAEGYASSSSWTQIPAPGPLNVELTPGGSVRGTVTGVGGVPLAGAKVTISSGTGQSTSKGEAETSADGTYVIPHLAPGDLRSALIQHADYGERTTARGDLRLPPELLKAGETLTVDASLTMGETVTGVVVNESTDAPVADVRLTLNRLNAQYSSHQEIGYTISGADGHFRFEHVLDGSYAIGAIGPGVARVLNRYMNNQRSITLDFTAEEGSAIESQRVVVTPAGEVHARIVLGDRPPPTNLGGNLYVGAQHIGWAQADLLGQLIYRGAPTTDAEEAYVQTYNPTAKSKEFAIAIGEVTEVVVEVDDEGGFTGVVEDENDQPLHAAVVRLLPANQLNQARNLASQTWNASVTDAQGRFSITIPSWVRSQVANSPPYIVAAHAEYDATLVKDIKLPAKGETKEVRVRLIKGGAISGQVVFDDGTPAGQCWVSISPQTEKGDKTDVRQRRSSKTDSAGKFEIKGVGPGKWTATAVGSDGSASQRDLAAGEQVRLEITRKEFISGFVLDEDGAPVANARVVAMTGDAKPQQRSGATTSATGYFRLGHLAGGTYTILVKPQSQRQGRGVQSGSFLEKDAGPVPTGTDELLITVSSGAIARGRVVGPDGKPVAGAMVSALLKKKAPRQPSVPTAITNTRGEFKLKGLGEERVEFLAGAAGFLPATTKAMADDEDIELRLSKGESIRGEVRKPDGSPAPNLWVWISSSDPEVSKRLADWRSRGGTRVMQSSANQGARTDKTGEIHIRGVFPGEYWLRVWSQESVAAPVQANTNGARVSIRLESPYKITGTVLDEQGQPIVSNNQTPSLTAYRDNQWFAGTRAKPDGTFELLKVPGGALEIRVYMAGYQWAKVPSSGGASGVPIVLKKQVKKATAKATKKAKR
ncbi:MAG: carboxypeptidase-like regulatory domain-containing protein [Planctomycetota bacterium]